MKEYTDDFHKIFWALLLVVQNFWLSKQKNLVSLGAEFTQWRNFFPPNWGLTFNNCKETHTHTGSKVTPQVGPKVNC